ncbi:hypothetical protein YWS52_19590 [Chitiniphilus shinanonensis]
MANNWPDEQAKPRGRKIVQLLQSQKYSGANLYVRTSGTFGETHAYPDAVCMAVLEYYAFEAQQAESSVALQNFRLLARQSLRQFVYEKCGYNPAAADAASWENFQARLLLNDSMPKGYFSVFSEAASLILQMIRADLVLDSHSVPDGSIGIAWAKHWKANEHDEEYGQRTKYPHVFPEWYPQSNADIEAWIYPNAALGVFKDWLDNEYIPHKLPNYLGRKVSEGVFPENGVAPMLAAVTRPLLAAKSARLGR